ncbi:MAG: family 16 glycoside hydrolase [Pseudomonadota bacterium]
MKKIAIVLVLALAGGAAFLLVPRATEAPWVLEEGYRSLYDGESLAGWRAIGGQASFAAEGPDIVGRHGPGDNTFLRTEETFGDFSLKLQVRWDEPGNSGVLFRAQQRDDDGRAYGYQYELDPSERAWTGGIYDEARRGWLAKLTDNPDARAALRLDDWNDVEIEARGPSLKTWINGVPAADILDGLDADGFIALQVHAGKTGVIRWRNIRIKPLPALAAPGDTLLSAREWRDGELTGVSFDAGMISGQQPGRDAWLASRRLFSDVMVLLDVPACEAASIVQMRYLEDENGLGPAYAEVAIYADRVEASVASGGELTTFDPLIFPQPAGTHRFVGITREGSVVLTVDELDALRGQFGLPERGELRISPADCGGDFQLVGPDWFSLREVGEEPLPYETLDTEPAPVLSPEEALSAFRIAPGFTVELVAAEPLVEDPVAMDWDEQGRLYVVEMRGYMPDAYGTGSEEPVGQVVRLTDANGDGIMDRSEVFLGELVNPRAVAVVNDGILIAEPPNLWLCELPTESALCDRPRRVGGYAIDVDTANVEHMENGLRLGLDNWLYNAKSGRQLRLREGVLEERQGLQRGQWGLARDDLGRWFYNHNSTWLQADFFAGEDAVLPNTDQRPEGLGVNLTNPAQVHSVRVNPGVNRAYLPGTLREDGRLHRATGASGLTVYRGEQFPEPLYGNVFVAEPAGNVVGQFVLSENGLEITARQRLYPDEQWGEREFLGSTDERFRPVDVMNGPDGALYIVDMYRGIIQDDHFLTDELREQIFQRQLEAPPGMGRIWRIKPTQPVASSPPVQWADASDKALIEALQHDNGWVRDTAQRLLLDRETPLSGPLSAIALGPETVPALHAVWTLQGRDELSRELVMKLAVMPDSPRQMNALRAGAGLLSARDFVQLAETLADSDEGVRLQLAFAMGVVAQVPVVRATLATMAAQGIENVYQRQALVRALRGHELEFLQESLADGVFARQSVGREALLAALAENAYRSLRPALNNPGPANPALLSLLDVIQSRRGAERWQQIAMLSGLAALSSTAGFTPAALASSPPIFSDGSVSEEDPLWTARLAGRRAFNWPGDELALGITPLSPEQLQLADKGEAFYPKCGACHGAQGQGIAGLAPALDSASWVTGPPEWLARIILQGMVGPVQVGEETFDGVMPPHGHLSELDDTTLAGLMIYLRRSWSNKAEPVSVEQVAAIRATSAERSKPWTAQDLQAVPYDRGFKPLVGKYRISFVTVSVSEQAEGLHMSVPMYGSGVLQQESDLVFTGEAAGESVKVEFVPGPQGDAAQMMVYRKGEKIPFERVE